MSKVIRVGMYLGVDQSELSPMDPPMIRLDCTGVQFLPKGVAIFAGGRDPQRWGYQLSLHSSKKLGPTGTRLREWVKNNEGIGACFIEPRKMLLGVRIRSAHGFDAVDAAGQLHDDLATFLSSDLFAGKDVALAGPQNLLFTEAMDPKPITT